MVYLFQSLGILIVTIGVHLFLYRRNFAVRYQRFWPVALFVFGFCVYAGVAGGRPDPGFITLWTLPLQVTSGLLFCLLTAAYFIFFGNASVDSPSQRILVELLERDGRSHDELLSAVSDEDFIVPRIESLVGFGWTEEDNGEYRLSSLGVLIVKGFKIYEKIIGRKPGG